MSRDGRAPRRPLHLALWPWDTHAPGIQHPVSERDCAAMPVPNRDKLVSEQGTVSPQAVDHTSRQPQPLSFWNPAVSKLRTPHKSVVKKSNEVSSTGGGVMTIERPT